MKRIFYLLSFVLLLLFASCDGSSGSSQKSNEDMKKEEKITVKGADGTEYESYQECCSMNDYDAAHRYLAKMENAGKSIYEASDYVFQQEALYLMSIGDEASKKRILYLLKEEGGDNDSRVDMLIDLAIDEDDEEFVKKLANQYTAYCSDENLRKVVEYLDGKDNGENEKYLFSLLKKLENDDVLIDYAISKKNDKIISELANKKADKRLLDYAIANNNTEIAKLLIPQHISLKDNNSIRKYSAYKDRNISDAIIQLLSKQNIAGRPYNRGFIDYDDGLRENANPINSYGITNYSYSPATKNHYIYVDAIIDYNRLCDKILDIAIGTGNQYLAQKCLICFKDNVITMKGRGSGKKAPDGTIVDGNYCYVYYTNDDQKSAQKKYQEAVKSGAFR